MSAWVPALLAFAAVAFGIIAIALMIEALRSMVRRRHLEKHLATAMDQLQQGALVQRELVDGAQARLREAQALASRLPMVSNAAFMLSRSGLSWSPTTFLLLIVGFAFAGGVFALVVGMPLLMALIFAAVFGSLPYAYVSRRRTVQIRRFEEQLPEAIDYLGRAIRAGHPLTSGIQMVGEELSEPIGGEFRKLFEQQRFGVPLDEALLSMCDRIELVDVRIFTTSILVQREAGGASFGEILDNMSETMRARFAIRREINVYTAQGRVSGMVVGVMPFLVGIGMYFQDKEYVRMLFDHPLGRAMAITALVLQIIGFLWIRRIVDVEI